MVDLPVRRQLPMWVGLVLALLLTVSVPHSARSQAAAHREQQRTLYVSTAGSDRASGAVEHPLRSIAAALRRAGAGTTILVGRGVYPETLYETTSGQPDRPLIVRAANGSHPVITGRLTLNGSNILVKGFVFVGGLSSNPDNVLVSINGNNVTLAHNELRNSAMSGVIVGDTVGVRLISNWIHDNGTHVVQGIVQDHGIYWSNGRDGRIVNNIIDHNRGFGIQLYPEAISTVVSSNTVVWNGIAKDGSYGASGIILGGAATTGNTVVNNIIAWNGEAAVRSLAPLGAGNTILNNLGYGNDRSDFPTDSLGDGLKFEQNVTSAPRFIRGFPLYGLGKSSPARHRAIPAFSPQLDFAGRSRFFKTLPDLGALQSS
ncbi:MAG: right-handed parallel beta-helix repeat-containing protein [Gaiellaceae bacterium]